MDLPTIILPANMQVRLITLQNGINIKVEGALDKDRLFQGMCRVTAPSHSFTIFANYKDDFPNGTYVIKTRDNLIHGELEYIQGPITAHDNVISPKLRQGSIIDREGKVIATGVFCHIPILVTALLPAESKTLLRSQYIGIYRSEVILNKENIAQMKDFVILSTEGHYRLMWKGDLIGSIDSTCSKSLLTKVLSDDILDEAAIVATTESTLPDWAFFSGTPGFRLNSSLSCIYPDSRVQMHSNESISLEYGDAFLHARKTDMVIGGVSGQQAWMTSLWAFPYAQWAAIGYLQLMPLAEAFQVVCIAHNISLRMERIRETGEFSIIGNIGECNIVYSKGLLQLAHNGKIIECQIIRTSAAIEIQNDTYTCLRFNEIHVQDEKELAYCFSISDAWRLVTSSLLYKIKEANPLTYALVLFLITVFSMPRYEVIPLNRVRKYIQGTFLQKKMTISHRMSVRTRLAEVYQTYLTSAKKRKTSTTLFNERPDKIRRVD